MSAETGGEMSFGGIVWGRNPGEYVQGEISGSSPVFDIIQARNVFSQ